MSYRKFIINVILFYCGFLIGLVRVVHALFYYDYSINMKIYYGGMEGVGKPPCPFDQCNEVALGG